MRPRLSLFALIVSLVGFGASLASLIDYVAADPTFCAESGCATVRASAWAHPLGVPMPVLGLGFFAVMTVLAFVERPRLRTVLAIAGAAWAIALIAIQAFVIGAWCKLCMIADPIAIVLALAVVAGARTLRPAIGLFAIGLPAIGALPVAIMLLASAPAAEVAVATAAPGAPAIVPDVIQREQQAGVATIVDFVDFECPFCRKLAPKLDAAIAMAQVPVRLVRKMSPLHIHPHAMTAALAWCCADAQGKGDEMAAALFAAPVDQLTPEGCEQLAVDVGCDRERYRDALADPATRERVVNDTADAKAAGVQGLPTIFIGTTGLGGADHEAAELAELITHSI
ncbi:MAG: vitamin K epoxide reductase family protein [Kofleriaceae bacterium]